MLKTFHFENINTVNSLENTMIDTNTNNPGKRSPGGEKGTHVL